MPVPKRRKSMSKSRSRRAANMRSESINHTHCQKCGEPNLPHHACVSCGYYGDKKVISIVEE